MTCSEFRRLLVEDGPEAVGHLREHARECDRCAELQRQHAALARSVERWKTTTAMPPEALGQRIRAAIERESTRTPEIVRLQTARRPWSRIRGRRWTAAAAALALVALGLPMLSRSLDGPDVIATSGRLLLSEALEAAEAAEREHARAIAQLERAAAPVLSLANDPATPAEAAAVLLAYRDRLASIDAAIAEVSAYLEGNPGLTSARTVLLAAYIDKTELLREVVAWNLERGA